MPTATGERIGAFLSANDQEIRFLGYGVHEGEFIVPKDIQPTLHAACVPNPRLKLDNGEVVWGCEVYWGPEGKIADFITSKGLTIVNVSIKEHRG